MIGGNHNLLATNYAWIFTMLMFENNHIIYIYYGHLQALVEYVKYHRNIVKINHNLVRINRMLVNINNIMVKANICMRIYINLIMVVIYLQTFLRCSFGSCNFI